MQYTEYCILFNRLIWFCAGSPLNQEGVKYDGGPGHIDPTFEKIEEVSIKMLLMHVGEMRISAGREFWLARF